MYTIYRSAAAFYECLMIVMIALLRTTANPRPPKKKKLFLYYPLHMCQMMISPAISFHFFKVLFFRVFQSS